MRSEPIIASPGRPRGERRRLPWALSLSLIALLAALVVVPFLLLRPRSEAFTLRSYEASVVKSGTLLEYVRGAGVLVPRIERTMLAPNSGVLIEWAVAPGGDVTVGSVLGRLESAELESELDRRRADLAAAERRQRQVELEHEAERRAESAESARLEREVDSARRDLELTTELYELGASSRAELEAARAALQAAEEAVLDAAAARATAEEGRRLAVEATAAEVVSARDALATAEARLERLVVRAPIAGRIVALLAAPGEEVADRQALVTVAAVDDLLVRAAVSEGQARRLAVGQAVNVRVAGAVHSGHVAWVAPQAVSIDGAPMVEVEVAFDAPPQSLRLGSSANVEIEVGRVEGAAFLPRGPYLTTGGERLAYVVEGDQAHRVSVVFGIIDGDRVEVRDGLVPGQRVITSSYESFREHTVIDLAPEGETRGRQL